MSQIFPFSFFFSKMLFSWLVIACVWYFFFFHFIFGHVCVSIFDIAILKYLQCQTSYQWNLFSFLFYLLIHFSKSNHIERGKIYVQWLFHNIQSYFLLLLQWLVTSIQTLLSMQLFMKLSYCFRLTCYYDIQ